LSWTASTSVVSGYNVYRSAVSGGPYTKVNSSLIVTTSYTDSTVQSGTTYFYVVTSVDASNVESAFSTQVSATIP
jgi:fibronectin type 3 domain-containing protein